MKATLCLIGFLSLLTLNVAGQHQTIEIEKPQSAKLVGGIVTDPSGAVVPDVIVEERSQNWGTVLRSTKTDENGRFKFPAIQNKAVYYLQLSCYGFDPLRIKVRIDKKAKSPLILKMVIAT